MCLHLYVLPSSRISYLWTLALEVKLQLYAWGRPVSTHLGCFCGRPDDVEGAFLAVVFAHGLAKALNAAGQTRLPCLRAARMNSARAESKQNIHNLRWRLDYSPPPHPHLHSPTPVKFSALMAA